MATAARSEPLLFDETGVYDRAYTENGRMIPWEELRSIRHRTCRGSTGMRVVLPWMDGPRLCQITNGIKKRWEERNSAAYQAFVRQEERTIIRLVLLWMPVLMIVLMLAEVAVRAHEHGVAWEDIPQWAWERAGLLTVAAMKIYGVIVAMVGIPVLFVQGIAKWRRQRKQARQQRADQS